MSGDEVIDLRHVDAQERLEERAAGGFVRCRGVGAPASPSLSETARCPGCGRRVSVITSTVPGGRPVRSVGWHEVPVLAGAG